MNNAALNFEIKRKIFHLCSIIFPLIYIFIPKITMCIILTIIASATVYLDVFRNYNKTIRKVINISFGRFLRPQESCNHLVLSGSSYMALGFLISCIFFSKGLAITSWFILIISDCFAALVGIKLGSSLFNGKSYAGAFAFFTSAILISIMSYFMIGFSTNFFIIIVSSFLTAVVEFFSEQIKMNDNLSIPLTYGLSTIILGFIF